MAFDYLNLKQWLLCNCCGYATCGGIGKGPKGIALA